MVLEKEQREKQQREKEHLEQEQLLSLLRLAGLFIPTKLSLSTPFYTKFEHLAQPEWKAKPTRSTQTETALIKM